MFGLHSQAENGLENNALLVIDSEVRKEADPGMANFRIGTLERFHSR
jgi:hypothetical protein